MPVYTFDCRACGASTDILTSQGGGATCCGAPMARRDVYPISIGGAKEQKVCVRRFIEASEELQYDSARMGVEPPDWIKAGKRKARQLIAAGEPLRSKVVPEVNV